MMKRLLFIFTLLASATGIVFAQSKSMQKSSTWYKQDVSDFVTDVYTPPETEMNSKRFAKSQVENTLLSLGVGAIGAPGIAMGPNDSALANIGSAIASLTSNPPVQTRQYLAMMASNAGFVDAAYAQGQERGGYDLLAPIQKIWVATRNVAYLVTSLILVVVGFMIMLRKKIDAQTVIGIQQALPKLVVTLLLITFSYAIAGLVIDSIYFAIFFGVKLLAVNGIFSDGGNEAIEAFRTQSVFQIGLAEIFEIGGESSPGAVGTAATAVGNLVESILGDVRLVGQAAGLLSQPIAFVIFAVAILYAVFKLFFALLMSYIQIILLAILGPLQLMLNALPGSDAFSKWFRNLLANAMAFPAAAMMIVFAAALMGQTDEPWRISEGIGFTDSTSGVNWAAPLVFGDGGGTTNVVDAVQALLGIGILLMTPKVVDMVKEALQAPEFKYGSAIGEAVGFGWNTSKAGVERGWGATRGYSENLAAQEYASVSEFTKLHGRAPNALQLAAIRARLAPQYSLWGPQGQVRGRLGKLFGK